MFFRDNGPTGCYCGPEVRFWEVDNTWHDRRSKTIAWDPSSCPNQFAQVGGPNDAGRDCWPTSPAQLVHDLSGPNRQFVEVIDFAVVRRVRFAILSSRALHNVRVHGRPERTKEPLSAIHVCRQGPPCFQ